MGFLFGTKQPTYEAPEPANVTQRDFATNQQSVCVPLFWGITRLGGTFLRDLYNIVSTPIKVKVQTGKNSYSSQTTGYEYNASFDLLLCMGAVDGVRTIFANDEEIWSGTVDRSGDSAVLSTTLGDITLYWGTSTQSGYRHFCWASCASIYFGQNLTPPTLNFELVRRPSTLSLTAHHLNDDAIGPEVAYDLLTNSIYGAGLSSLSLDADTFEDAAETTITEGLGISPVLTQQSDLRTVMGDLLSNFDGAIVSQDGKLQMVLQRASSGTPQEVGIDELTEEPQIERPAWADTWSETRLTFSDRDREFNSNVAIHTDLANASINGISSKAFQRPWVTRYSTALSMAAAIGTRGGLPIASAKLTLRPSVSIEPGEAFTLVYAPLGIVSLPLIATRVEIGGPDKPIVEVEAIEDISRLSEGNYSPEPPDAPTEPVLTPEDSDVRIAALPSGLKGDYPDGLLVAASRPNNVTSGGQVYTNWDLMESWKSVAILSSFPTVATLNRWRAYSGNWLLDITITHAHDQSALIDFRDALEDLYLATCLRRISTPDTINEHSPISTLFYAVPGGRFELVDTNRWEIEVAAGQFGSNTPVVEVLPDPGPPVVEAVDGQYPCQRIYVGRLGDFAVLPTENFYFERSGGNNPSDTDEKRYVLTTTATAFESQDLGDPAPVYFDRNDTSKHPDGSLYSDWGSAVEPASW